MLSIHRETAVEKLFPKIPGLIQDCMQHLSEAVMPYFEKIRKTRAEGGAVPRGEGTEGREGND